jgi:hypothetical protein
MGGCDSIVSLILTVHSLPLVAFALADTLLGPPCIYAFPLSGGVPAGGHYSGAFVAGDSLIVQGYMPYTAFNVTYTYSDTNGCRNSDSLAFKISNCQNGILEAKSRSDY